MIDAVRVPPSAWSTSQSIHSVRGPSASRSTVVRNARPMSRWISTPRPSCLPLEMSRALRVSVEYGSIEYSAVIQPPVTPCSFIQRGTPSSMDAAQMTRVLPVATSTLTRRVRRDAGGESQRAELIVGAAVVSGHGRTVDANRPRSTVGGHA